MLETSSVKSQVSGSSAGKTIWPADRVERWPIKRLVPYARNARTHSDAQIGQIAASIREWGWTNPVLVAEGGTIIAGHGRVRLIGERTKAALAAKRTAGTILGNPRNLDHAGSLGRAALARAADEFASSLTPAVQAIRATGALTLASMAIELNRRGIRSARGGKWHRSSVRNLLARIE